MSLWAGEGGSAARTVQSVRTVGHRTLFTTKRKSAGSKNMDRPRENMDFGPYLDCVVNMFLDIIGRK
jgi:hypothetical protein